MTQGDLLRSDLERVICQWLGCERAVLGDRWLNIVEAVAGALESTCVHGGAGQLPVWTDGGVLVTDLESAQAAARSIARVTSAFAELVE